MLECFAGPCGAGLGGAMLVGVRLCVARAGRTGAAGQCEKFVIAKAVDLSCQTPAPVRLGKVTRFGLCAVSDTSWANDNWLILASMLWSSEDTPF